MTSTKKHRLRVKVPVELATEIAQKGIGAFGPERPEVMPGVRVVTMWTEYLNVDDVYPIEMVVQWGDRYFMSTTEFCYIGRCGDVCDPDEDVFHYNELGKEIVEFREVFPKVVKRTVWE